MAVPDKTKPVKLTAPQVRLLTDIATKPQMFITRWSRADQAAQALIRKNMAATPSGYQGTQYALQITDAGADEAIRRGIIAERPGSQLTEAVDRCARGAISRRLGSADNRAVIAVEHDHTTGTVMLHVNSGGNALAAEEALRAAGYHVEPGPPVAYGSAIVVTARPPAGER